MTAQRLTRGGLYQEGGWEQGLSEKVTLELRQLRDQGL